METENDLCYFHITMSHILAILGHEVIGFSRHLILLSLERNIDTF